MSVFTENLRELREARGLTQDALAELAGTSKQVLSRYENGLRVPKISMVEKLAKALNVSINELTGEDQKEQEKAPVYKSPLDEKWHMLSAGVENLPDYRKQAMIGIVESAMAAFNEARNEKK